MINEQRIKSVKNEMEKSGLDAVVCRLPENVLLLSGYWPLCGMSYVVFPREGEPVCVVPHTEESEAVADLDGVQCLSYRFGVVDAGDPVAAIKNHLQSIDKNKKWKKIGYEGTFEAVAPPWNAAEPAVPSGAFIALLESVFGKENLVDASALLDAQKSVKTDHDIEKIKITNEIANIGLQKFLDSVEAGISGVELVSEVEYAIMREGTGYKGTKRVRSFAQVSTGPDETVIGYRPMEISTRRKMGNGEIALLELAVAADGYWSDRTRPKVAGRTTEKQNELFNVIKKASKAVLSSLKPGMSAGEADEIARNVIREAGFESNFVHITGHGVGFRYHDPAPFIAPGNGQVLKSGMVHTLEPGVYVNGIGGIRIEDNVVITETGGEILATLESSL